jgi:hypothetical protein
MLRFPFFLYFFLLWLSHWLAKPGYPFPLIQIFHSYASDANEAGEINKN